MKFPSAPKLPKAPTLSIGSTMKPTDPMHPANIDPLTMSGPGPATMTGVSMPTPPAETSPKAGKAVIVGAPLKSKATGGAKISAKTSKPAKMATKGSFSALKPMKNGGL